MQKENKLKKLQLFLPIGLIIVVILIIGISKINEQDFSKTNQFPNEQKTENQLNEDLNNKENAGIEGKDKDNQNIDLDKDLIQNIMELNVTKKTEHLEFSNIVLEKKSGAKVEVRANVKNDSMEFSESKIVEIKAIDENDETIAIFSGLVSKLAAQEETKFVTQVLKDITVAKDLEFSIVK